jgi:hypothetical protein
MGIIPHLAAANCKPYFLREEEKVKGKSED